jgi:murein DD-endopeptidase MepM/ murein hydrolase activator NlpD
VSRTYIVAILAAAAALAPSGPCAADPSDRVSPDRPAEPRRHDYSRYSDGPRRVPEARGASFERARGLGLGTREAAGRALHRPAEASWIRAAAWRGREVDRLLWPVDDGRYVRGYGYVRTTRPDLIHEGVDISAPAGTAVRAAADGIVAYSDNGVRGYGNCVILVHPNGWVTLYAHSARTTVQAGWRVRRGERIALVGATGIAHGPHVHFELHDSGRATDPLALFDGGPDYVRRVAARAFAAGRVPAPRTPSGEDVASFDALPPWGDTASSAVARAEPATSRADDEPGTGDEELEDHIGGLAIGSAALARRLLRFRPTEAMASAAGGRRFSNLLWPVRGGAIRAHDARGLRVAAEEGSAVRASVDGLVAYVGRLGARGQTVVLLHRSGWVTIYRSIGEAHVAPGQRVERGEWIATAGSNGRLDFELRREGRAVDPRELLVHVPGE